jgi:hypothetical protein
MSILERPPLPPPPAFGSTPRSDRLRVVTGGHVGHLEARLGTSGFDVVAVAETEHALIDAVSADEPDAIVVDADLCESLEHVRDLAPDAVLIVVGDHTPAGALGRIEPGVSGTVMAGLLHALIAEGVGAASVWGLVPAFQSGATLQVPQPVVGPLLYAKLDLLREYLVNALNVFRDHAELVAGASTVAVTVSAGVLLTLGGPRTDEGPARVPVPAHAMERTPQERAPEPFVFAVSLTKSPLGPFRIDRETGARREPNRGSFRDHGRHHGPVVNEGNDGQVVSEGNDAQVVSEGNDGQVVNEGNDGQVVSQGNHDHGTSEDPHGQNGDVQGQHDDPHGKGEDDQGVNQDEDDQGQGEASEVGDGDDQGNEGAASEGQDDQGENGSAGDQGGDNDDQGEDNDGGTTTSDPTAPL